MAAERRRSRSRGRVDSDSGNEGGNNGRIRGGGAILQFGMHSGRRYDEVLREERGYVEWALRIPNPGGGLRLFQNWLRLQRETNPSGATRRRRRVRPRSAFSDSEDDSSAESEILGSTVRNANLATISSLMFDSASEEEEDDEEAEEEEQQVATRGGARPQNHQRRTSGGRQQGEAAAAPAAASASAQAILDRLPRVSFSANHFGGSPHPESCPICIEDFADAEQSNLKIVLTSCLHVFHEHCLQTWLQRRQDCPTCRWDISDSGESQFLASAEVAPTTATAMPVLPVWGMEEMIELSDESQG
eukprot:TRINITY_DN5702_c0_g1_i2.p1 TRINITY_DN5702_c0_g1~~TRINITY_DN5702_c0_g1_i2.p1  ORF type:complete len:323 (-),score=55.17 TRINITY_DN5702_c0_g1_i2:114-1022(-)